MAALLAVEEAASEHASAGRGDPASRVYRARGLCVHFSGVRAVDGVDLSLHPGEILGVIGPNGAGKTTLVNALTGYEQPTAGAVWLGDRDVTGAAPHKLARLGVTRTFQSGRLFGHLTVLENVSAAALAARRPRRQTADAHQVLESVKLDELADRRAETLSHGEARRLELARAIATRARFLLLDEPAAGLNEIESDVLVRTIAALPGETGCGILVIEHDMRVIMRLCTRIQVLNFGTTIAVGTPREIRTDPRVREAYLGTDASADAAS